MTACNACQSRWGGYRTEHCPACHETFTGTRPGDMHRVGEHGVTEGEHRRRCLTVEEMTKRGMARNGHGIWTTGQHMPEDRLAAWGQETKNASD